MAKAVVRTDLLAGTDVRSMLVSAKYMGANGATPTEIENGNILKVKDLLSGEREIFKGETPKADSTLDEVVLVASEETMYDAAKHSLDDFTNEAGAIVRGYRLHSGDIFSVTKEALNGTPAVGSAVALDAGTKLKVGGTGTAVGKIIATENAGKFKFFVIKVD